MLGLVADFPTERDAWMEVCRRGLLESINIPADGAKLRFSQIAQFYMEHKIPRMAPQTQYTYKHVIGDYLSSHWGDRWAEEIKPLEVQEWLVSLSKQEKKDGLEWTSIGKIKYVFTAIYQLAEKFDKIPANSLYLKFRDQIEVPSTSDYVAVILSPAQTSRILGLLTEPCRTVTLLVAATGLRYSEIAGLQWQDLDWVNSQIHVRRTWNGEEVGPCKTRASRAAVPMCDVLAQYLRAWQRETCYARLEDWVFASDRTKGKTPRVGNVLAADYLRPAAIRAGVKLAEGQRFGFHNFRHSLASFLISEKKADVRTTQDLLRHSNSTTTIQLYSQSSPGSRLAAQEAVLDAILTQQRVM